MKKQIVLRRFMPMFLLGATGLLLTASLGLANPADLDPGFGTDGHVIFEGGPGKDRPWDIAFGQDDGIFVNGHITTDADDDLIIQKYSPDGSLDTTFGTGGQVTYDTGGDEYGFGLLVQPDGKIVSTVINETSSTTADGQLLRYNPDGTPDTSFGTAGVVTFDRDLFDHYKDLALQTDGKIVVVGNSGPEYNHDGLTTRYNSDGTLDTGFGTGGIVTYDSGIRDTIDSVQVQPDGKIVVSGYSNTDSWDNRDAFILRYNSEGTLDTGFGVNGIVLYDEGMEEVFIDLALQDDGKILAAGYQYISLDDSQGLLLRYNVDGTIDTGFGVNGSATVNTGLPTQISSLRIQEDGRIVTSAVSGFSTTHYYAEVFRFNNNGSLDEDFGDGGVFRHESCFEEYAIRVGIQPDGKIVMNGVKVFSDTEWDILLLRLIGSAPDLTVSPPSGNYVTSQNFDLVLMLEAQGVSPVGANATLDGTPITNPLIGCSINGTLATGGQTFRCPIISGNFLGQGTHVFAVTLELSDGTQVSDSVTWKVKENTEP